MPNTPTDQPSDEWVDVSTAIIADTTTGKVRRIRYRRLIGHRAKERSNSYSTPNIHGPRETVPSIVPYEKTLDEEFVEDEITVAEPMVAEAVERVIAHTGDSKATSSSSSRSNSKPRTTEPQDPSSLGNVDDAPRATRAGQEVPRNECRSVILSALADLIQDVIERREDGEGSAIREAVRSWVDGLEGVSD